VIPMGVRMKTRDGLPRRPHRILAGSEQSGGDSESLGRNLFMLIFAAGNKASAKTGIKIANRAVDRAVVVAPFALPTVAT